MPFRKWMLPTLAIAVAWSCLGCMVRSVYPWLKKDGLMFEEDLLGGWVGIGERGTVAMTFVRGKDNSYVVQYSEDESHGVFNAYLGKFGADYYLDFWPADEALGVDGLLLFPTHSVARLEIAADTLTVRPLNYGAVKVAAKLDRLRDLKYGWDAKDELIVVSNTEDLQRWLLSLGRNSDLYAQPIRLTRKK